MAHPPSVHCSAQQCCRIGAPDPVSSSSVVEQVGSHGSPEYAQLEYYDPQLHMPYASYHVLYLGTAKKYLSYVVSRLSPSSDRQGAGAISPFSFPTFLKGLVGCRLKHFVLRSSSKCGVCNFAEHLGLMSIAEMQLLYEVALPYIMHDWVLCGVPESVVLMGCDLPNRQSAGIRSSRGCRAGTTQTTVAVECRFLQRHACMRLTRLSDVSTPQEYEQCIQDAKAAMFACNCISEHLGKGSSMPGTEMKAHLVNHLADMALARGHPTYSNDMWVERMLRSEACKVVRCVCRTSLT